MEQFGRVLRTGLSWLRHRTRLRGSGPTGFHPSRCEWSFNGQHKWSFGVWLSDGPHDKCGRCGKWDWESDAPRGVTETDHGNGFFTRDAADGSWSVTFGPPFTLRGK